jgi:hypothetical protein
VVVGAAVFFGFSESETSQSSCLLAFILYLSPALHRPLMERSGKVEARTKERFTSSDSSLSSSCHFDLAEGLGKTGAGGVEVPEVGSSISTISPLSLFEWWTYPSRPLCICTSIYVINRHTLSFTFHLVLVVIHDLISI